MTTHDCNSCEYDYKPKQPKIRELSKEQCEWLSTSTRWKEVYGKTQFESWHQCANGVFVPEYIDGRYGLPVADPFWKEWDEMQKPKCYFADTCSIYVSKGFGMCANQCYTGTTKLPECYNDNRTLVKIWSISNSGYILREYSFRGQPDWERIKCENDGAEKPKE